MELIGGELALAYLALTENGDAALKEFFGHPVKEIMAPSLRGVPDKIKQLEAVKGATFETADKLGRITMETDEQDPSEEAVITLLQGMHLY